MAGRRAGAPSRPCARDERESAGPAHRAAAARSAQGERARARGLPAPRRRGASGAAPRRSARGLPHRRPLIRVTVIRVTVIRVTAPPSATPPRLGPTPGRRTGGVGGVGGGEWGRRGGGSREGFRGGVQGVGKRPGNGETERATRPGIRAGNGERGGNTRLREGDSDMERNLFRETRIWERHVGYEETRTRRGDSDTERRLGHGEETRTRRGDSDMERRLGHGEGGREGGRDRAPPGVRSVGGSPADPASVEEGRGSGGSPGEEGLGCPSGEGGKKPLEPSATEGTDFAA